MAVPQHALVRAVAVCLFVTAFGMAGPGSLAPLPASADDTTLRVYGVTFNGRGVVEKVDGAQWRVYVSTYNNTIYADECSAIVFTGTAPAGVVSCKFFYEAYFTPDLAWPCTGQALATGHMILDLPSGDKEYEFPGMRAVIDEGTVHAIADEVVDPVTGQRRSGYAQFDFASQTCGTRVQNFGRALY